jgi:hypothetical protein
MDAWIIASVHSIRSRNFSVPNESVTIHTGSGTLNNTAVFMGKTEPVWGNSGDIVILKDGIGTIIDQRSEGSLQ